MRNRDMRGMMGDMMERMGGMPIDPRMMHHMMFMMDEMMHMTHHMSRSAYHEKTENGVTVQDYDPSRLVMQEMLYQSINRVVDNSDDINTIRINGEPVLSLAIERGWNELVDKLINKGATLKGANADHLYVNALKSENKNLIHKLLDHGLEFNEQALILAIKNKDMEMVDLMLKRGVVIGKETEDYFLDYLNAGKFDIFKKLVEHHGLNINARNQSGATFLQRLSVNSIYEGEEQASIDAAKFIISSGVDINNKLYNGRTALDFCFDQYSQNRVPLITFLIEQGAETSNVYDAFNRLISFHKGNENEINLFGVMLKNFKDVDHEKLTDNLLYCIGRNGSDAFVRCAVENGITISDDHYVNVIDRAIEANLKHDSIDGLKGKMDALISVDPKNKDFLANSNGLLLAAKNFSKARAPFIEYLLEQNLDPNKQDEKGNTPLMLIVKSGKLNEEAIISLLKHGADPTIENESGDSPMNISRAAKALIKDIRESLAQEEDSGLKM